MDVGDKFEAGGRSYEILGELGEGGYATAYSAKQRRPVGKQFMVSTVVVKVPSDDIMSTPSNVHRFIREARILGNIDHPHVVGIIGHHELEDGTMVLIQKLVKEAKHIDEYVREHPESAPSLYLQALYALREIHHHTDPATIHRDVSPSNLLVDEYGKLKLIDFGIALENPRATAKLTRTGGIMGTPGCEAPELHTDPANVDHRADIYALGKSIAAAVSGHLPIHVRLDRLLEPWRTICERACEHEREARYPNADEAIADALLLFESTETTLCNLEYHMAHAKRAGVHTDANWRKTCTNHFLRAYASGEADLSTAGALMIDHLHTPHSGNVFDAIDSSEEVKRIEEEHLWDDADPFGSAYEDIFGVLDDVRKLKCFKRMCRIAINCHRYSVMSSIRSVYREETDEEIRAKMFEILRKEDPAGVIHGRGIIPPRPEVATP